MERIYLALTCYLKYLNQEGFFIDMPTYMKMRNTRKLGEIALYFIVERRERTDEEIDQLARQHKVELYLIIGMPIITIKYKIREDSHEN